MKAAVTVKENYEFRRIYRKGKSLVSPQMVLYWQKNRQGQSRLGITVSTKLGHAVVRNRVRRRFRELYRLHKPEMQPGFDVILVARGRAVRSTYQQLDEAYLRLLRQAGLVPEDFEIYTTYEASTFCKPNPAYYLEVARTLGVKPEECLMVGNDATEDMAAREVGMDVFLLTDCLINAKNRDLNAYPRGDFAALNAYIDALQ